MKPHHLANRYVAKREKLGTYTWSSPDRTRQSATSKRSNIRRKILRMDLVHGGDGGELGLNVAQERVVSHLIQYFQRQHHYCLDIGRKEAQMMTSKAHLKTRGFLSIPCLQATYCVVYLNCTIQWYNTGKMVLTHRPRAVDQNYAKQAERVTSSRRPDARIAKR